VIGKLGPNKRIASLFLLPHCDMRCTFCASRQDFSVMAFNEAERLLRALRARSIENVVLGGGEPFLWPHDVLRLSRLASGLGFVVQICTNGTSMPAGFERIECVDRYILPLESMDPGLHDGLRIHPAGHHALVRGRIERLVGSERSLTVSTVVTSSNLERLAEVGEFLEGARSRGIRVHAWHLYRFLPVGRGGARHAARLAVSREGYHKSCSALQGGRFGFPVYRRPDMLRSRSVEYFWIEGGRLRLGSESFIPGQAGPAAERRGG